MTYVGNVYLVHKEFLSNGPRGRIYVYMWLLFLSIWGVESTGKKNQTSGSQLVPSNLALNQNDLTA